MPKILQVRELTAEEQTILSSRSAGAVIARAGLLGLSSQLTFANLVDASLRSSSRRSSATISKVSQDRRRQIELNDI